MSASLTPPALGELAALLAKATPSLSAVITADRETMNGSDRSANFDRTLTRSSDFTREGLAVDATRPIPHPKFPDYGITPDGRVFSLASNWRGYGVRELRRHPNTDGYLRVRMQCPERHSQMVHRLVADVYLPPKPSPEHQIRHLNGDRTDNRAENLAWGTAAENAADRQRHGTTARGGRNGFSKLTEDDVREIRRRYRQGERQRALGAEFGVRRETISNVVRRIWWNHVA